MFNRLIKSILVIGLLGYLFFLLWHMSDNYPFNGDEHEFVKRGGSYVSLIMKLDFKDYLWKSYTAYDVPQLPSYIYGITLLIYGHKNPYQYLTAIENGGYTFTSPNGEKIQPEKPWWWQYSEIYYRDKLNHLPQAIQIKLKPIIEARKGAVVLATAALVIIFLIGIKLNNWLLGLINVFILFINPVFQSCCQRAMAEAPLLLFLLLSLWISLFYLEFMNKKLYHQALLVSSLFGLTAGLSMASKLTGSIVLVYFFYLMLVLFFSNLKNKANLIRIAVNFLRAAVITIFIFMLLNPFTWRYPGWGMKVIFEYQVYKTDIQQLERENYGSVLRSPVQRLTTAFKETLLPRGKANIVNQLQLPLGLILFIAGLFGLFGSGYKKIEQTGKLEVKWLPILWGLVFFAAIIVDLPFNWDHYYVPLLPILAIFEAYGLFFILTSLSKVWSTFYLSSLWKSNFG